MSLATGFQPLREWLTHAGVADVSLEANEDLLIVKLAPSQRARLLADADLRQQMLNQAKAAGFSRVALDLTSSFNGGVAQPGRAGDS